jgi:hypothetical protein
MPPASEQIPGIITNTVERTIGAPIMAAKRLGEATTAGTLDPTDRDTAGAAFGLVGGLAGTRVPFAEPGAAGIFGGRLAKTADLTALDRAQQMEKTGAAADNIWDRTGWFKGKDEQWRFEIPDKAARWIKEPSWDLAEGTTMEDVLHHPELYARYPDIAKMPIMRMRPSRFEWSGMYNPEGLDRLGERIQINRSDPSSPRSIVLHELQHAVQAREGFDPGGMPSVDLSDPKYRDLSHAVIYNRGFGETEARSVERRQNWSARQRQQEPPWVTQSRDVPLNKQIVSKP